MNEHEPPHGHGDVATLLRDLGDDSGRPLPTDGQGILALGKRTKRRRQTAMVGGAVATCVALAVAVPFAGSLVRTPEVATVPTTPATTPPSTVPSPAPTTATSKGSATAKAPASPRPGDKRGGQAQAAWQGKYWKTEMVGRDESLGKMVRTEHFMTRDGVLYLRMRTFTDPNQRVSRIGKAKYGSSMGLWDWGYTFAELSALPSDKEALRENLRRKASLALQTGLGGAPRPAAEVAADAPEAQEAMAAYLAWQLLTSPVTPEVRRSLRTVLLDSPAARQVGPATDERGRPGTEIRLETFATPTLIVGDDGTLLEQTTVSEGLPGAGQDSTATALVTFVGWVDELK